MGKPSPRTTKKVSKDKKGSAPKASAKKSATKRPAARSAPKQTSAEKLAEAIARSAVTTAAVKKRIAAAQQEARIAAKEAAVNGKPSAEAAGLHRKALRHNWDNGTFSLSRLLAHPACDHGTAFAIYWMGAPGHDQAFATEREVPAWRRETFRFLRRLEKRLLARDFATSVILFNPRCDRTTVSRAGHDWTAAYADTPTRRPIPAALMEPSCDDSQ